MPPGEDPPNEIFILSWETAGVETQIAKANAMTDKVTNALVLLTLNHFIDFPPLLALFKIAASGTKICLHQ